MSGRSRVATATIALSAVAAICFIVTVAASTGLIATMHPEAPVSVAGHDPSLLRAMMALLFLLGLVSLLESVGAGGWIRSRMTGWATSAAAAVGVILLLILANTTG
ncbi:MAG: hypothetical protein ACOY45_16885 [Pseudomonadota bacterium]